MDELSGIVESGNYTDLLQAIAALNDRKRKSAANWFVAQWKERGAARHPRDASEGLARWMRLLVGLTAAADDPKKALAIPAPYYGADLRWAWEPRTRLDAAAPEAVAALAQAAIDHGPEWSAQYLALVTDAKKPRAMFLDVLLLAMRAHGIPSPPTSVLPIMWATLFNHLLPRPAPEPQQPCAVSVFELSRADDTWCVTGRSFQAATAAEALRANPDMPALLFALFDHRDAVLALSGRYLEQHQMDQAAKVVTELVTDGTIDSTQLAGQAIAALSRGDSVSCQRLQTRLLKAARPSMALVQSQSRVLANLLASASAPAASLAQDLLRQADAADALPDDLFVDACQMVFGRKEKGLREAQLGWARERAARPAGVASAVNGLSSALLSPDHGMQKAAAAAIGSAWPTLDATQRPALLAQIEASEGVLDAALYASLWVICAGSEALLPVRAALNVAPRRTCLEKRPFESVPDLDDAPLPADVTRAFQTYQTERSAEAYERAIWVGIDALNRGNAQLAGAISAKLDSEMPFGASSGWREKFEREMSWVAHRRITELKEVLSKALPQPFVSRPSWSHGAIAPGHLADRLAALADAGTAALPVDLLVALLRTEAVDGPTIARLREIGSAQSRAAAAFLAAGGAAQLTTRWLIANGRDDTSSWIPHHERCWSRQGRREVCVALDGVAHLPAIDGAPLEWAAGFEVDDAPYVYQFDMVPDWITPMLPNNAEALAALHLWGFRRAGLDYDTDGGKAVAVKLPLFVAAHGAAGPALHLAVLFTMSANDAPVRLVGSDGMVTLLQQGRWQDALAAELLAECLRCATVKTNRLASSLAQVREAGETAAVWALVRAILPTALSLSPAPPGLADLLSLASQAASELGAKEHIAELAAMASAIKGKPNKLQSQVQRLHATLTD